MERAAKAPLWADYANYCVQLEGGLRQAALEALELFLRKIEYAPFQERKCFVSWLMHQAELSDATASLVPYPLKKRLIDPTLAQWKEIEPLSSEPHRWLGTYDHLKRAIMLDPTDEIARRKFIACIVNDITYSAHELPSGYLADPIEDLAALAEAELAAARLNGDSVRQKAISKIGELKSKIESYLRDRN